MPDIHHSFIIKAPIQKVFDGFCLPEHLNNWWPKRSSGNPLQNEKYNFYFGDDYNWYAEVIEVVPGKSLTWDMQDVMDDWKGTRVGFELREEKEGTKVRFFHTRWKEASDHFAITNFCWGQLLQGLKDFLETGKVLPFEKRN